jgi:hypothetical protein
MNKKVRTETKIISKNQPEVLELNNSINEIQSIVEILNSRIKQEEFLSLKTALLKKLQRKKN